jgi:signal transduction histidine kinase
MSLGGVPDLEHQLRKEQKLEIMGALASLIAHDLNNELTVILGNVGLALDTVDEDHSLHEGLVKPTVPAIAVWIRRMRCSAWGRASSRKSSRSNWTSC